jgi:hypothetical protein
MGRTVFPVTFRLRKGKAKAIKFIMHGERFLQSKGLRRSLGTTKSLTPER